MIDEYDDENVEDTVFEDSELEDNPLYQALTSEPDDGGAEDEDTDEDEDLDAQDGDSPEVLRAKLTAKNRIMRQKAKTTKRLTEQVAELQARTAQNNNGINKDDLKELIIAAKGGGEDDEANAAQAMEDLKERVQNDPSAMIDYMMTANQTLENRIAGILQDRDAFFMDKMAQNNPANAAPTPEIMKLVEAMKLQPQYEGVDEKALIAFAKDLKPLAARVTKRPPARTGGRGALPFDAKREDVEKTYASQLDQMGYGND